MADIEVVNVTAKVIHSLTLPNMPGEVKRVIRPELRLVMGTITIATVFDYDTTKQISLDNLFDAAHASYIGLKKATCRTVYLSPLLAGTLFYRTNALWPTMKIVLFASATAAELADGVAIGSATMTIDFAVVGEVVGT